MTLFDSSRHSNSRQAKRFQARVELVYTSLDFIAALAFLIGSVLFLWPACQEAGTWLFIFGSLCFAIRPGLHFVRDLKLAAMGQIDQAAAADEQRIDL